LLFLPQGHYQWHCGISLANLLVNSACCLCNPPSLRLSAMVVGATPMTYWVSDVIH
jgi:hypothetical protein